ncbi:hypothetical protein DFH05DRAFT_697814 [Lentinula detonsa]|uniref:Uncharacterized protein n=1 Tax=Lentinula detonsa TaxID=2804962 RepID=A0A9W8P9I9_9AGAR|nr:hypothetical protein DFH05DRAFT_697814 [Lentinula detonsa]
MRYASAYYLGLIGLLSLARAMPMNQQPSGLNAGGLLGFTSMWVVDFLENPPPNMQNPPSTGVDHLRSVVASVSEDAKTIIKSYTRQRAESRDVVEVSFKNDYPFSQIGKFIYYSAHITLHVGSDFIENYDDYGWVATEKDDKGKYHGSQSSHWSERLPSPSKEYVLCPVHISFSLHFELITC